MEAISTFSVGSQAYADNRPQYPAELFGWIALSCQRRSMAWDCATGNGQAAAGLAKHFDHVEATDVSAQQIEQGFDLPNVRYSVQPAERTDFDKGVFDLVAVAQALHWFELDRFWDEVRRVAAPGAFFCAWGYSWFDADPDLTGSLIAPLLAVLEPFWATNNQLLWRGYRSDEMRFPFKRIEAPAFSIAVSWTPSEILNYLRTWSAYKRAREDKRAAGSLSVLETQFQERFSNGAALALTMPITVLAGSIS